MSELRFIVEYARSGRASCKDPKCKQKIEQGSLRIAKAFPMPNEPDREMSHWFHVDCFFDVLQRGRTSARKVESESDLEGFDELEAADKKLLKEKIGLLAQKVEEKAAASEEKGKETKATGKRKKPSRSASASPSRASKKAHVGEGLKTGKWHLKSARKLFDVSVDGKKVTIRFGSKGQKGKTESKEFESHEHAVKFANAQAAAKTRKGYSEVDGEHKVGDGEKAPVISPNQVLHLENKATGKFWEISVDGDRVSICFGRLGAEGKKDSRTFESSDQAARFAGKQVEAKKNAGFA